MASRFSLRLSRSRSFSGGLQYTAKRSSLSLSQSSLDESVYKTYKPVHDETRKLPKIVQGKIFNSTNSLSTAAAPVTDTPSASARRLESDFREIVHLLHNGGTVVDVRDSREVLECGAIPGALHIPVTELKEALMLPNEVFFQIYHRNKPVHHDRNFVFFARGPRKSMTALEIAHRLGFKLSRHYAGGWEDWAKRTGQPIKKTAF